MKRKFPADQGLIVELKERLAFVKKELVSKNFVENYLTPAELKGLNYKKLNAEELYC